MCVFFSGIARIALRNAERGRIVLCDMTEERPDGCQSHISSLYGVLPLRLEVVEEGEDKIAVEIGDRQCAGLALRVLGGEQDQQAQPVAIAGDGRLARIALLHHAMTEEGLQQRRKGGACGHATPPSANARSAAMPSRSAVPVT